jgi:hypothetical protein
MRKAGKSPVSDAAPDALGAFIGWRAWAVSPDDPGVLRSMNDTEWPPGMALVATCRKCRYNCPGEECHCGIYAKANRAGIEDTHYPWFDLRHDDDYRVYGPVWLWGGVVEHMDGYRAAKAYPKRLIVPHMAMRIAKPLYESYNIPGRKFSVKIEDISNLLR